MKKSIVTTLSLFSISFLIFAGQIAAQDPTKVVSNPPSPTAISTMPVSNTASATVASSTRATSAPVRPLYRRDQQGYISQTGQLTGISGIGRPSRIELTPYVVTKNETRPSGSSYKHPQSFAAGADLRFGLSSNLTVNATINPDFGQVEADPSVLNLSAFEQFFEERRPFFLEGSGIFSFKTNCGDIDTGCTGLFYSRRIGRSPQLSGVYGDQTSATNTTIIGAAKVTGRLGKGMSVGLLDAVTQREVGRWTRLSSRRPITLSLECNRR